MILLGNHCDALVKASQWYKSTLMQSFFGRRLNNSQISPIFVSITSAFWLYY
jgi:hypothetical protein